METLVARIAKPLLTVALWFQMRGQNKISVREVAALFDSYYPQEVLDLFAKLPADATREQIIQALREIANCNAMGASFAQRADELNISLPRP